MADLNQIKVLLVQKKRTGKWLAEQLGKSNCTVSNGVRMLRNPISKLLNRLQKFLMLTKEIC